MSVPAADNLRRWVDHGRWLHELDHDILAAADLLEAIDVLHRPYPEVVIRCEQCDVEWPCPTTRLLRPEAQP